MDSCSSIISDWSIEQLEWLDDQGELYVAAFKDNDLSFFSTVNQLFLDLWPVRVMLWLSKPTNECLINAEQRRVYEAEDQLKMVHIVRSVFVRSSLTVITSLITAHQMEHYPQSGQSMLDTHTGEWSNHQLEWLNVRKSAFLSAYRNNKLRMFWPSVLENFFKFWPMRQVLWPMKPTWQILTVTEWCWVLEAEGEISLVSLV